jgi:hypothetical protein
MGAHEGCPRGLTPVMQGRLFYKSSGIHSEFTSQHTVCFSPSFFAPGSHENMISPLGDEEKTGRKIQDRKRPDARITPPF